MEATSTERGLTRLDMGAKIVSVQNIDETRDQTSHRNLPPSESIYEDLDQTNPLSSNLGGEGMIPDNIDNCF
jgi:hypothetical protein